MVGDEHDDADDVADADDDFEAAVSDLAPVLLSRPGVMPLMRGMSGGVATM